MLKQFKCIKGFAVDSYDENEMLNENEQSVITEGSLWEQAKHSYMSDVRLEGVTDAMWLEITFDNLKVYFEEVTTELQMDV